MIGSIESLLLEDLEHQESGRYDRAESTYGAVLECDPDNAEAWHGLCRVSLQKGDWRAAAARVLQAIRRRPEIPAFHTSLGEIPAAQGRAGEAALCYREALRLEPGHLSALVNLGNALQGLGRHREACVAYWRATQARPDCAEAFRSLGHALRAAGHPDEALTCYQEAHRLEPDAPAEAGANPAAGEGSLRRPTSR